MHRVVTSCRERSCLASSFTRNVSSPAMAYLCSRVATPGDAVHFTSFAFGESPHGTVQFSSGEAIWNNTSGIETVGREETPAVALVGKKRRNPTWAARMRRAFTASRLPELGGRCPTEPRISVRGQWDHYERVQSTQPSVRQTLWTNFFALYAGGKQGGTKGCLRETCTSYWPTTGAWLLCPWMLQGLHKERPNMQL